MSLLMDALKKAEEEKKRAAKQLEEVEGSNQIENSSKNQEPKPVIATDNQARESSNKLTRTMELSLEPLDAKFDEAIKESTSHSETISEKETPTKDASGSFSEDLTLENTVADEAEAFEQTHEAIDLNDTTIIEGLSTENASAPFDDTFHGVILENEDQASEAYEETEESNENENCNPNQHEN